jgi:hypothetical protein
MDPFSIVIGVAGLTGVFTACIDGFNYFADGKQYRGDSQIMVTQLDIIEFNFRAWAQSIGLEAGGEDDPAVEGNRLVKNGLVSINELLKKARETGDKYVVPIEGETGISQDIKAQKALKGSLALRQKFKEITPGYQKMAAVGHGIVWGIRDKKQFAELIGQLQNFVGSLESACDKIARKTPRSETTQAVMERQLITIADKEALEGIQESAHGIDDDVEELAGAAASAIGKTVFSNMVFTDNATGRYGSVIYEGQTSNRSTVHTGIQAGGDSRTVMGDVIGLRHGEALPRDPLFERDALSYMDDPNFGNPGGKSNLYK